MNYLGELACVIKQYGAVATFELNHAGWMGNPALSGRQPISSVAFTRGVFAETVDIYGKVTGRIEATGKVKLHRGAELCGECHAPMLIIKPGATHHGRWEKTAASSPLQ